MFLFFSCAVLSAKTTICINSLLLKKPKQQGQKQEEPSDSNSSEISELRQKLIEKQAETDQLLGNWQRADSLELFSSLIELKDKKEHKFLKAQENLILNEEAIKSSIPSIESTNELEISEKNLKEFSSVEYAITCASGTDALILSMLALNIGY